MSSTGIRTLDGLAARMKHLNARQNVVSQNIANADTPGYRSKDLEEPDFARILGRESADGSMRISRPRVGATPTMVSLGSRVGRADDGRIVPGQIGESKPNGNDVVLEEELLKLGDIQSDYSAAASVYRKSAGLLKVTIGK